MSFEEAVDKNMSEWKDAIGSFFVSFCQIEAFTYRMIETLLEDDIYEDLVGLGLAARLKITKKLMIQKINDDGFIGEFEAITKIATGYTEMRNTIAHNPVEMELYDSPTGIDLRHVVSRRKLPWEKRIKKQLTIDELRNACEELWQMSARCELLASDIDRYLFENRGKP